MHFELGFLSLLAVRSIHAHGGASHGQAAPGASYMERHMANEHHIDSFDPLSFFNLHDLDRDGILDRKELEAIYGVHHETSRAKSGSDEAHEVKTEEILSQVLAVLDMNGDGVVTKREFLEAVKRGGLPNFEGIEGLGHHYDTEGEYFLHHEELYHNTPETQTDEAYNHPEDIEHFRNHEAIEAEEDRLDMKAQGLDPDGNPLPMPVDPNEAGQRVFSNPSAKAGDEENKRAKKYAEMSKEAAQRGSYNTFKRPKDQADRLRVGVPWKYKVRGSVVSF